MRILFLNQYFPPDPAPTGILFQEIGDEFKKRGHEIVFADADQEYRAGQGKAGRLLREFGGLFRIFWGGVACRRAEVVISGSSPPCLAVVAGLVALRHRAAHLHWCMDLYPEIAVALREVRQGFVPAVVRFFMKLAYRRARAVVGLDADMVEVLGRYAIQPLECRPWVPETVLARIPRKKVPEPADPWTWLYSGNLGRAHDWQTLLAAQASLEERGVDATLVFQGGGPARAAAEERAKELKLKRVVWRPYAPEKELCNALLRARCLVVTELPEVRGLLWPSKLALLLGLPRPLLFVGPKDGAIARVLQDRPQARLAASGDFRAVADWITELRTGADALPPPAVVDVVAHRRGALNWWVDLVERAGQR